MTHGAGLLKMGQNGSVDIIVYDQEFEFGGATRDQTSVGWIKYAHNPTKDEGKEGFRGSA